MLHLCARGHNSDFTNGSSSTNGNGGSNPFGGDDDEDPFNGGYVTSKAMERAGVFLVDSGCELNLTNSRGETALHAAAAAPGAPLLAAAALSKGADPNVQTINAGFGDDDEVH